MERTGWIATVAALGIACGNGGGSAPKAAASAPVAVAAPAAAPTPTRGSIPRSGDSAPNLTLLEVGGTQRWSLQTGLDPTGTSSPKGFLLAFMASWCTYCTRSLPTLVQLEAENPDLEIVTISIDEGAAAQAAELEKVRKAGLTGPVLAADAQTVSQWIGGGKSVPKYYFVDHDGVVSARDDGYTDDLSALLAKQATHALAN